MKRLDDTEESTAYVYDIRGHYVAYEIFVTTRQRSCVAIRSVDARTGRTVVNQDAFTGAHRIDESVAVASGVRLLAGGSVAWISVTDPDGANHEVRYAAKDQPARVLDEGADIDSKSLAVTGGYVCWTAGGQAQVARVP